MGRGLRALWFRQLRLLLAVALIGAPAVSRAETVTLECKADAWLEVRRNKATVHGADAQLKLEAGRRLAVLVFDATPVRGWKIREAALFVHVHGGRVPTRIDASLTSIDLREDSAVLPFAWPKAALSIALSAAGKGGWLQAPMAGPFIDALAEGRAKSILIDVRGGKEECLLDARESGRLAPYIVVDGLRVEVR